MGNTSDASAGGAGGAAGVGFQNEVFAWAASSIVAEEALLGSLVAGILVTVGAQAGAEVDDVVVLTDQGNAVYVQAKIKLQLSAAPDSPLAKALHQAVRQYSFGSVPQPGGISRPFDPLRDVIALGTNQAAPSTIRVDLEAAVARTASLPEGTPLGNQLTKKEDTALTVALDHVRRIWASEKNGAKPTDEELRRFLRCLRVLTLDLADGGKDQQAAISMLHRGLEDPAHALGAWQTLVTVGQDASETRSWRDRASLTLALAVQGHAPAVNRKYASAIATIRDRSTANLAALQAEALLPLGDGLFIARSVSKTLRDVEARDPILIVGDAGSGKSGVLQDFATSRKGVEEVVVLLAADVAGANRLDTGTSLQEVLRGWTGLPALLVIDGVDALRGSGDRESLSKTVTALSGTRWQVVASARSFDTTNSRPLQKAFAGSPISTAPGEVHGRLASVRHLLVGDLSDSDLDREILPPMPLASVLAEAPSDLRGLLRNPFNLRLAAELAASLSADQRSELLRVRSRVELLGRYWDWRIRVDGAQAREALLRRLVAEMVSSRRLQVEQLEPTVLGTDTPALEDLLSQDVLTAFDGPISGLGRIVGFSHNILFDYATAIYLLYSPLDTDGLVKKLDADPTLPLITRPSFDLLVDMMWQARSEGAFWPTALAVADSDHVLASLAVAARLANLAVGDDDLIELAVQSPEAADGRLTGRQHLARQLSGAVRARAVVPDPEGVVAPLARLAIGLAANAHASYTNAALAADIILGLESRVPIGSVDHDGATDRGRAIALLLDTCRLDPAGREQLVGPITRQVQFVIAKSEEVRDAVRRVLDDDDALAQWGGTVTAWFPEAAVQAAAVDADLAHRLAVLSVTFEETRDEQVSIGNSTILRLNESRQQQAQHATYILGEKFPELASADVSVAARVVCSIVGHAEPTPLERKARERENVPKWPMETPGATGWIEPDYGFGLSVHWHDDEQKMLKALAATLIDASDEVIIKTLDLLVEQLHAGWCWAGLMNLPSAPARLFQVLQPAFATGTLLAHPSTYTYGATLLKAAAEDGKIPHSELEAAVTKAIELLEEHGRGDHIKEVLVACLDAAAIGDPDLVTRRQALGDDVPEIPSPPSIVFEARAWSAVEHILEEGVTLGSTVESAARALEDALRAYDESKTTSDENIEGLTRTFVDAHAVFSVETRLDARLEHMLLDGAVRLSYITKITPDHPVGPLVLEVLEAKADDGDAGRFLS